MLKFDDLMEKVNVSMLQDLVNECNSWDGSLDEYYVYDFDDEFFEMFFNGKVIEAVRAAYFGNIQNWNDDYIYFNGYGNLCSMSNYEYYKLLEDGKEEIINCGLELYQQNHIYLSDELEALLDEYLEKE